MVPHLVTALSGPLAALEETILGATAQIERWLRLQWLDHTPPIYGSVDVRNGGYKIAPVDTNLFPGGWNNLSAETLPLAIMAATAAIEKYCPDAKHLLLIPENHTRNTFYLQNVIRLTGILRQTGLVVRLGSLNPDVTEPTVLDAGNGQTLTVEPLQRVAAGNRFRVGLQDFSPCAILLNNDLSAGLPDVLKNLAGNQVLLPPLHAGWAVRRKSHHFAAYDDVARQFAKFIDIDHWLINPYFKAVGGLNFHERVGEEALAQSVSEVLERIRRKYKEYKIAEEPFVIVKADAGTYGMGIMKVRSPDEVVGLNRKERNKMSVVKEGLQVQDVLVQEGVPTIEQMDGANAEPVVYMMDKFVVGGFYRINAARGRDENLNAPGMTFKPLPFEAPCNTPDCSDRADKGANRFYTYGVIGRLALLAASLELERTDPAQQAQTAAANPVAA
jgi:glutamate--cysteine ligase